MSGELKRGALPAGLANAWQHETDELRAFTAAVQREGADASARLSSFTSIAYPPTSSPGSMP